MRHLGAFGACLFKLNNSIAMIGPANLKLVRSAATYNFHCHSRTVTDKVFKVMMSTPVEEAHRASDWSVLAGLTPSRGSQIPGILSWDLAASWHLLRTVESLHVTGTTPS